MKKILLGLLLLIVMVTSCEPFIDATSDNDFYVKKIERSNNQPNIYYYYIGPKVGSAYIFRIKSTNTKINLGDKVVIISKENGEVIRF